MERLMAISSLSSNAFSNPHKEANEPLMRASPVLGLLENSAPFAGEPG